MNKEEILETLKSEKETLGYGKTPNWVLIMYLVIGALDLALGVFDLVTGRYSSAFYMFLFCLCCLIFFIDAKRYDNVLDIAISHCEAEILLFENTEFENDSTEVVEAK
jgi:hypothetical protein